MLADQIKWVVTQTKAGLLFDCYELASSFKNSIVAVIIKANKLLKKMNEDNFVKHPKLNEDLTV